LKWQTPSGVRSSGLSKAPSDSAVSPRVWVWSSALLSFVILGWGVWTALSTARTVHQTFSPVYYWDQYAVVTDLQQSNGVFHPSRLWAQHNEYRIVLGRLALLADLQFFQGRNADLLVEIYLIQLVLALFVTWICRQFGKFRGAALITVGGFFIYCIFCPLQIENFYWGFQVPYVFAGLAAAASFACVVWHAAKVAEGKASWISWPVLFAFIAGFLAEYSLADGLIVWPVILWLGFSLRLAKRTLVLSAVVGFIAVGSYFIGYVTPPEHSNPWLTIRRPLSLAKYVTTYIASTWDSSLPSFSAWPTVSELSTILAVAFVLGTALRWLLVRSTAPDFLRAFLVANLLLTVAAAVLTGLGRLKFGLAAATLSRYQSIALVFWACLAAFVLASIPSGHSYRFVLTVIQIGLVVLLIANQGRFGTIVRLAKQHRIALDDAYVALANNSPDLDGLKILYPQPEKVAHWYNYMRSHNLGTDPREFYNWGGYRMAPASNCVGSLEVIRRVSSLKPWLKVGPWDATARRAPDQVILALPSGLVVGMGEMQIPRPDIQAAMKLPELRTSCTLLRSLRFEIDMPTE
jgi:hypothetical protein